MKKTILSLATATGLMVSSILPVFATAAAPVSLNVKPGPGSEWNKIANLEVGTMVGSFVQLIMVIASLLFFFMLVAGGVQWIVSGGDKAGTEGAKNRITAALIGLVVVFSAWAIATLIGQFFGISILNLVVPTIP